MEDLTEGHIVQAVPGAVHHGQPFGVNQLSILPGHTCLRLAEPTTLAGLPPTCGAAPGDHALPRHANH